MSKFTIDIDCDNQAFDDVGAELRRILKELADSNIFELIELGAQYAGPLTDINGNRVGHWSLEP